MALERRKSAPLGKILLDLKKINLEQLSQALILQREKYPEKMLGEILIDLGYINNDDLHSALALQFNYPHIQISKYKLSEEILSLIPKELAQKYKVVPLDKFNDILTVAVFNPSDRQALEVISKITALEVRVFVAYREELEETIALVYK